MLHKIELPAYKDQLECVLDFQQHLLAFACDSNTPVSPDPQAVIAEFGKDIGDWLCKRLWGSQQKQQKFYKQLVTVIAYVKQCPLESQKIVEAFEGDRDYYHQLDNSAFEFKYGNLDAEARKVLAPLMVSFYEKLLYVGFPPFIHQGQDRLLNRAILLQEFRRANPRLQVCPGCDGPRTRSDDDEGDEDEEDEANEDDEREEEDDDEGKDLSDIDHFFPKKAYPFFSIHPFNLVPLCTDCNVKVKRQKDPVDVHGPDELSRTFLPFVKPAVSLIEVSVSRKRNGKPVVYIRDKEQTGSRRVDNLDRVFKLRRYWKKRLLRMFDLMQYQLSEVRAHEKLTGEGSGEKIVRQKLYEYLGDYENNVGFIEHLLIHGSYARYAIDNPKEFEALLAQLLRS